MRNFIGLTICLMSVLLGLYVGLWLCFVGGIVQFIEGIKANPVDALTIAIGTLRFVSSSFCGYLSFIVGFGIGRAFLE